MPATGKNRLEVAALIADHPVPVSQDIGPMHMISRLSDPDRPVRFGTRGSALAMVQTELAIARFRAAFPEQRVEIRIIKTEGDLDKISPLTEIGGRGVFTNAIESAILAGEVDVAVHSAKDLPTKLRAAAPIVAFPIRDDPRDVLVSRHGTTLDQLPPHPVIGTSSRRRDVQIMRLRPDARIVNLRGNIDTRLRKAEGLEYDAIVLAAAGIKRMGWDDRISDYFAIEQMVPSPAQGAIAIQALAGSSVANILRMIDDAAVSTPVGIERAFLAAIGAGCTFPVGAYAEASDAGFRLVAMLANGVGDPIAFADESLTAGEERAHAAEIAARLRAEVGMTPENRSWNGSTAPNGDLRGARVVVTRPRRQAGPLIAALAERGAEPLPLPTIRTEPLADVAALDAALRDATRGGFDWLVFTSANAVDAVACHLESLDVRPEQLAAIDVAVVGQGTAAAASAIGLHVKLVPVVATAESLAAALIETVRPGSRILYPRSAIGRDGLPDVLRTAGLDVETVEAYRTLPETDVDPQVLEHVRRGEVDLIVFSSPSSVRNLVGLLGEVSGAWDRIPVVCAGPVTGHAAREAGFLVVAISDEPGAVAIADAISNYWRDRGVIKSQRGEAALSLSMNSTGATERSAG